MVFGMYSKIVRYYMNTAGLSPVITRCGPKSAEWHRNSGARWKGTQSSSIGNIRAVHSYQRSGLVLGLVLMAESLPVACDVRCPHVK